jgi:hypothetical protein
MPGLPDKVQSKVMILLDAEQQALTTVTMNQRQISESQRALDVNPNGDKAQALAREIGRLSALQPDNQARHRALADLNARVSRFLEMLPAHAELDDAKPIRAKLGEGETHIKVVTRMRSEIMALLGERSRVERSSSTRKEQKAAAARFVLALGEPGTPRPIVSHDKFELQFGRGVIGEAEPTPLQVLAWFDPPGLIARLEAMIDAQPKSTNQMTSADRKKRLHEISSEIYELERLEQGHLEAARAEGTMIEYRPNTDVRALIGLVIVKKDKAAA